MRTTTTTSPVAAKATVVLRLKERRDLEAAKDLVERMMAFLELDAYYDEVKQKSVNFPTSKGLEDRANVVMLARREARSELMTFIRTKFPARKK